MILGFTSPWREKARVRVRSAMARYEHLPVYKKAMDLAVYVEQIVRCFCRYHKYTLGSQLREKSREIVGLIIKANCTVEGLLVLYELREKVEGLKVQIRICKEVSGVSTVSTRMSTPPIWWLS